MKKYIFTIILLSFLSLNLVTAQESSLDYSQFSEKIKAGDSITWEITDLSFDDDFSGEITETQYPTLEIGSKITVKILKDIGNLEYDIHGSNSYDPNEYFEETVDGTTIQFRDHYVSPQIFVESSSFNDDGSLSGLSIGTIDLLSPTKFVYTNNTVLDLTDYFKIIGSSPSVSIIEDSDKLEIAFGDEKMVYHKETGILLDGKFSIFGPVGPSATGTPIHISFKVVEYNGDLDLVFESDASRVSVNFILPMVSMILVILKVKTSRA